MLTLYKLASVRSSLMNMIMIIIIVVQTGKLICRIFLGSKIAPPPLKFVALFGRTPRTCPRPALQLMLLNRHHPFKISRQPECVCTKTASATIIFWRQSLHFNNYNTSLFYQEIWPLLYVLITFRNTIQNFSVIVQDLPILSLSLGDQFSLDIL